MRVTDKALGRHVLVEAYECNPELLDDIQFLQEAMVEAATRTGAEVVDVVFRKFQPYGVSGVVVISESHLAIHTWPEYGYAAIDLFTCGETADPWKAFSYLAEALESKKVTTLEVQRGRFRDLTPTRFFNEATS
ncbi:MAG: S-adenosylmethionine decarboxylase proenzyme [Synergistetes bacterium]|nr:S-adenosylmethionine decarboxylase proenzyme [Synergistota bacterium]MDK2871042.1 S-adenosylmethionine decarboxylase [bacterium]